MAAHIGERVIQLMTHTNATIAESRILVMGLSYKEDCPDLRNTRIPDLVATMEAYRTSVDVYDPWVSQDEAHSLFGIHPVEVPESGKYDAVVIAVAHNQFKQLGANTIKSFGKRGAIIFDVKHMLDLQDVTARL